MDSSDYEYRGLIAASWDLLRGDTSNWDDRFFYKQVIEDSGQPALDVGCGTGRLLLDYLSQGVDIDGVDNSPEMLDLCRQKAQQLGLRPNLYRQSMEHLDLPRRYRTIIVPSSSFQLVVDPQAAALAMHRFFEHLEPGGTLVMPFMVLAGNDAQGPTVTDDWNIVAEAPRPEDGALVRRWARSTYDLAEQLEHTEDRYEVIREGEVVASEYHTRSPATRWYTQDQAVDLYRQAGFSHIRLLQGFTHAPAAPEDSLFSVLGKRR